MGLIQIENMEFYSFHGHFKEERIVGNKFTVDLIIETDMKIPAQTDNLKDAVNYQLVYEIVKKQMEIKSKLLENVGKRILDELFLQFPGVIKAEVKVSKLNPPLGGKLNCVSLTLIR